MRNKLFMATALLVLMTQSAIADSKWQSVVEIEGRMNSDRSILSPKLLLPLSQTSDSMLFADIRLRLDDNDSEEYNLGLGFRRIQGDWIFGGYGFIDYLSSANGFEYWQATGGVEALSETWEARMNAYLPESTKHSTGGGGGLVIDGGGNFGIAGGLQERALPGVDAEVGYRLPVNSVDLTLFGGFYYFDASGFEKVAGPKARAEMTFDNRTFRPMPEGMELTFGVQYQNDGPREGTTTALAELRIPFGGSNAPAKRTLEKRMTDFIERDIDIIAAKGGAGSTTPATATINGQTYSGIGATIDANTAGVNASLTTAGAGALVVFDGTAGNIAPIAEVRPLDGQALIGGGSSITVTAGGKTATGILPGARPTVQNMIFASNVSDVTVKGIDVNTASGAGVFMGGGGTANFLIEDVTAITSQNGSYGLDVFLASDVTINNVTASAANMASVGISGGTNVTMADVTTLGSTGVYVQGSTNVSGTVDATASATPCDNAGGNTNVVINLVGGGTCP